MEPESRPCLREQAIEIYSNAILQAAELGAESMRRVKSAHSDDVGRAFRLMSATCSDRSRPAVPIDVGRGGGAPAGRV